MKQQNSRRQMLLQSLLTLLAAATLAVSTIAWFYNLKEVKGGGTSVNLKNENYALNIVGLYYYNKYGDYSAANSGYTTYGNTTFAAPYTEFQDTSSAEEQSNQLSAFIRSEELLRPCDPVFQERNDKAPVIIGIRLSGQTLKDDGGFVLNLARENKTATTTSGVTNINLSDLLQVRVLAAKERYVLNTSDNGSYEAMYKRILSDMASSSVTRTFYPDTNNLTTKSDNIRMTIPLTQGSNMGTLNGSASGEPITYVYIALTYDQTLLNKKVSALSAYQVVNDLGDITFERAKTN